MAGSIIIKNQDTSITIGSRTQRPRIPGVFPATQFGEQVVSTGIPSLDGYIGGGILLGSIIVIKDDYPSRYADLILKCFIAEGASYNHHLFVSTSHVDPEKFANELPSLKKDKESNLIGTHGSHANNPPSSETDKLKIAWRYKHASPLPVTLSSRGGIVKGQKTAKFEFTKRSTVEELGGSHLHVSQLTPTPSFDPPTSQSLLLEIANLVKPFDLTNPTTDTTKVSNLIRIGISHCETQVLDVNFMFGLRAIVHSTNSCVVITISSLGYDSKSLSRLEHFADTVIQLEAILDEKKKTELGHVNGLCKVQKINSLNSLKLFVPPTDLGFSYKKKRIAFQELHLPPEGETTAQREVGHSKMHHPVAPLSSCGSNVKGVSIDF